MKKRRLDPRARARKGLLTEEEELKLPVNNRPYAPSVEQFEALSAAEQLESLVKWTIIDHRSTITHFAINAIVIEQAKYIEAHIEEILVVNAASEHGRGYWQVRDAIAPYIYEKTLNRKQETLRDIVKRKDWNKTNNTITKIRELRNQIAHYSIDEDYEYRGKSIYKADGLLGFLHDVSCVSRELSDVEIAHMKNINQRLSAILETRERIASSLVGKLNRK